MQLRSLLVLCSILAIAPVAPGQIPVGKKSVRESTPPQPEVLRLAGEASSALRQGDFAGAIQRFEKLTKLAPATAEFHSNLGIAYYSAGRFREAIPPYRQALRLKPGLAATRCFLGICLAEIGQCKEALAYLETDYPRIADLQLRRLMGTRAARCAMGINRTDKAVDFIRLLNRDLPEDPDVLYLTALVYSELSTRASQQLVSTAPSSYQAHQFNAEVMEYQGRLEDAKTEYRKVLSMNPRLPGIHCRLGQLLLAGERGPTTLDDARREFELELANDPASAAAHYELGEMARQARRWDEAVRHFRKAAELEPEFVGALVGLGKSLVSAGRAGEAVAPLEAAVTLAADDPTTHYQLSFAYRRVGREEEARKELALYREMHDKVMREGLAIRTGFQGRLSEPQTDDPPE